MRTHDDLLIERFHANPEELGMFLQIGLEDYQKDRDLEYLMSSFRLAIESRGGAGKVARHTKMTKLDLEKRLNSKSMLYCLELADILHGLGYKITLEPLKPT